MGEAWSKLIERVLEPERRHLAHCDEARARWERMHRVDSEARSNALRACEARIEELRAEVFAASDGVVPARMTELEREWRWRARHDNEAELVALWAHVLPPLASPSWVDRKAWRDSERESWVEAAIALAADIDNVQAAEAAIERLRELVLPYGLALPRRTRWRLMAQEGPGAPQLFEGALEHARSACPPSEKDAIFVAADGESRRVYDSMVNHRPDLTNLASDFARATFLDFVWRASALRQGDNPVGALSDLWQKGYAIAEIEPHSIVLWLPPLAHGFA